jgi:hypothetical protein
MTNLSTASHLYAFLTCPTGVYLDAFGDRGRRDEISSFVEMHRDG